MSDLQGEQVQGETHDDELELLRRVLAPLGPQRLEQIVQLTREYLEDVSPLTWCAGQSEPGEAENVVEWEIGAASPLNQERTVFAMFFDPELRAVVAYSFTAVQVEGQEGALATYHREYIYRPRYATGPIALSALFQDLEYYLTPPPDEEIEPARRTNGSGSA